MRILFDEFLGEHLGLQGVCSEFRVQGLGLTAVGQLGIAGSVRSAELQGKRERERERYIYIYMDEAQACGREEAEGFRV